jgi:hypothetical protein
MRTAAITPAGHLAGMVKGILNCCRQHPGVHHSSPIFLHTQYGTDCFRQQLCMCVLLQPAAGEQCRYEDCPTSTCADTPGGAHSTPLLKTTGASAESQLPTTWVERHASQQPAAFSAGHGQV